MVLTSAKYPLVVVEVLLEALGPGIGSGYDIGCGFGTTLDQSPLGDLARKLNYKVLVGSFHGHTHNHLFQLAYLATYVKGMGLKDLEGCERLFSKSNTLALSLRYASVFHRKQKIVGFMQHMDTFDTYQNLSTYISVP
jgi:Kyakuja-Dileera-Zisupton transposase